MMDGDKCSVVYAPLEVTMHISQVKSELKIGSHLPTCNIYFATMVAGYSILGFYLVEVMHSFTFIRS